MSIVQYLVIRDELTAQWRSLQATECRAAALAYGQHSYIAGEAAAWQQLSAEDRGRIRAWAKAHGFQVLVARTVNA